MAGAFKNQPTKGSMNKSDQLDLLATALAVAQGQIKNASKDSKNPFFKSAYSTLTSVRDAINDVFTQNGLAITQLLGNDDHGVTVETVLLHKSGQWLSGVVSVRPVKDDPQALGSAVTYARRYSLSAIAGIASEIDDDGEAAMARDAQKPRDTKTATPKSTPPPVALAKPVEQPKAAPTKATPPPAATDTKELLPGVKSIIGTFNKVFTKEGTSSRGAWVKASVRLGDVWYSTFDERLRGKLDELKDLPTEIRYMTDSKGFHSVVELLPAEAAPTPEPQDDDIPF